MPCSRSRSCTASRPWRSTPVRTQARGRAPDDALFRAVLLDLVLRTAEACGGFDWDDVTFDRAYAELERSLFGERRTYVAVAPLVGLSVGAAVDLGPGIRLRALPATEMTGQIQRHWPEAGGLLPTGFGREPDRYCVLELRSAVGRGGGCPRRSGRDRRRRLGGSPRHGGAPRSRACAVRDTRRPPVRLRPVLPIAATQPPGEPTRLDGFRGPARGRAAGAARSLADADTPLAEALDRWELSLFQHDPFRAEQLRAALSALLGGTWPLRAAILLEDDPAARASVHDELVLLADGADATPAAAEAVREALLEVASPRRPRGTGPAVSTARCSAP